MKTRIISLFLLLSILCGYSQNPIIQTKFTADPAPMVYDGTVFLHTTHDQAPADGGQGNFQMFEWLLYTSTDMVNWTDYGVIASLKSFSWNDRENGAWAHQCIERNGKFYLYITIQGRGIGVLVSDSPYGPFTDPIGKPLIFEGWQDIDPTVFIDDDGQAYMYWGNPDLYYIKLNEDMISVSGKVIKDESKPITYQEGPWVYKRNDIYYNAYASTCCPEGIGYAMSNKPFGAWETKGYIMRPNPKATGNHPGIIDFKGKTYIFGFDNSLHYANPNQKVHAERRSVCVAEIKYNADGTIQEIPHWTSNEIEPVQQICVLNPYKRTEAETIAWSEGLETEKDKVSGMYVTSINNNDYIKVNGVDFGNKTAKTFTSNVAATINGGSIEIWLDAPATGVKIGTLLVSSTGGMNNWKLQSTKVKGLKGKHDVYFVFKGEEQANLFNFDYWIFK